MKDLKGVGEVVLKFCRRKVHLEHIYKHLRHWRIRWVYVRWVEETKTIMMDDVVYFAHINVGSM
jgi:hypothetical protein